MGGSGQLRRSIGNRGRAFGNIQEVFPEFVDQAIERRRDAGDLVLADNCGLDSKVEIPFNLRDGVLDRSNRPRNATHKSQRNTANNDHYEHNDDD